MFNIGSGEMLLLFVVALMIFGPDRLPEFGRSVGEALQSFRSAMKSLSEPIMAEVHTQSRQIREAAQPPTATASTAALPPAKAHATTTSTTVASSEPPAADTSSVSEPVAADREGPVPAAPAATAEELLAAAERAESSPAIEEPESEDEEHVPVPMKPS